MASINNVLVMDNRETPLKFVGRKKVPEGISKGTGFKGVPTEQQKYYIFKNYTEPALLLKNQQQESEVVKAIKEALGVKTVVSNTSIVKNFGFEDEEAQQNVLKERRKIITKLRKDKEFAEQVQNKHKASTTLQAYIRSKIDANDLQPAINEEITKINDKNRSDAREILNSLGKNSTKKRDENRSKARDVLNSLGKKKKEKPLARQLFREFTTEEQEKSAQTLQAVVRRIKPNNKLANAPRTNQGVLKETFFNSRGGAKSK